MSDEPRGVVSRRLLQELDHWRIVRDKYRVSGEDRRLIEENLRCAQDIKALIEEIEPGYRVPERYWML